MTARVWFLKTLRDVFTKAHGVDPGVPRLNPGALRNVIAPDTLRERKGDGTHEETLRTTAAGTTERTGRGGRSRGFVGWPRGA